MKIIWDFLYKRKKKNEEKVRRRKQIFIFINYKFPIKNKCIKTRKKTNKFAMVYK